LKKINCELGLNTAPKQTATYAAVLTTFNAVDTLDSALESILNQSIQPSEILIIDDCSTDETYERLLEKINGIPNTKVLRNPSNMGQSYSKNLASRECTSDLLIFFDDDDIAHPERSREHLGMMQKGADISFVSSIKKYPNSYQVLCKNNDSGVLEVNAVAIFKRLAFGEKMSLKGDIWIPSSTSAIKRDFLYSLNGFDVEMRRLEDAEFVVRAALNNGRFAWSSKILVDRFYTVSPEKGGTKEMLYEEKFISKFQFLVEPREYKKALRLIMIRRAYFAGQKLEFISLILKSPNVFLAVPSRVINFFRRLSHDWSIRNAK
jgi:glycosyltransferase involved in cell wall biosynthesis